MATSQQRGGTAVGALVGFIVIGFFWLLVIAGIAFAVAGGAFAGFWVVCAFVYWLLVAGRIAGGRARPSAGQEILRWCGLSLIAPVGLIYTLITGGERPAPERSSRPGSAALPSDQGSRERGHRRGRRLTPAATTEELRPPTASTSTGNCTSWAPAHGLVGRCCVPAVRRVGAARSTATTSAWRPRGSRKISSGSSRGAALCVRSRIEEARAAARAAEQRAAAAARPPLLCALSLLRLWPSLSPVIPEPEPAPCEPAIQASAAAGAEPA